MTKIYLMYMYTTVQASHMPSSVVYTFICSVSVIYKRMFVNNITLYNNYATLELQHLFKPIVD